MASSNPHPIRPARAIRHPLPPTPAQIFLAAQRTLQPHDMTENSRLCHICQEPFFSDNSESERAVELPCRHILGADCLSTWLEEHNTCPMCRTILFEKPAMTFTVPNPHMVAAMGALSDELLRRVRLVTESLGEEGGDGASVGSEASERAGEVEGGDGAVPGIELRQQATQDEAGIRLPTVDDDPTLAQALQVENGACLPRLWELETEAAREEGTGEIPRLRDRMMGIEERLGRVRERMRRQGEDQSQRGA